MDQKSEYYADANVASDYDAQLSLPIVRTIRSQEQRALIKLFTDYLQSGDSVLEVGAGTGFYTFDIASRVKSVMAQEPSGPMADILSKNISRVGNNNIQITRAGLFELDPNQTFDHVVVIGVLDYVTDWKSFLDRCVQLSTKTIIFSAPQKGFWSWWYFFLSKFIGVKIHRYSKSDFKDHLSNYTVGILDTGLKSVLTSGMTLIVTVTKVDLGI